MKEIIKITELNGKKAVSARELYLFLTDNSGNVTRWMSANIENNNFADKGADYQRIMHVAENNRKAEDYVLSIDFAKELCMMSQCEKGKQARQYFIECEKQLKLNFEIPQTYSQALMLAAKQAEQIDLQQNQIKELAPKAEFFDTVTDSKTAIDMGKAAKVLDLGFGRNKMFEKLRELKVLMHNNQPYQKYIDCGYFRVIESKFSKPDGSTNINIKTLVYQKGLNHIIKILK